MQPLDIDDAQRRSVEKFLEAVIRDAHYKAKLAAAFLKEYGFRPSKGRSNSTPSLPEGHRTRQCGCFLLNLGAAMQILAWERAGLRRELPTDLPTAEEAFRNLMPAETPGGPDKTPIVAELSMKVFRTWLQRFSRSSRATLNTDVLLPAKTVSEDELLDALADFLWANRHLADAKEESKNGY